MSAFKQGDIVVYRVGSYGTTAPALTTGATAVFLDEYDPTTGMLVQSITVPTADASSTSTHALTASGSASAEGYLTLSSDGRYLVFGGYDVGPSGTSPVANAARTIARVDGSGNVDTTTVLSTTTASTSAIRGVASEDGSAFYYSTGSNGVRYAPYSGAMGTAATLNTTQTTDRTVDIFGHSLYFDSASTIDNFNSGGATPTAGGTEPTSTSTVAALSGATPTSGYQFFLADLSSTVAGFDTLYVADDSTGANGGIRKYSLGTSGTWALTSTIGQAGLGLRGLTGYVDQAGVHLVATSASAIYTLTDATGYGASNTSTLTALALKDLDGNPEQLTAGVALRGVAFAPSASVATINVTSSALSQAEGDAGTTPFTYTLTRSSGTADATVSYAVTGTGAHPADASDFVGGALPSGTATFVGTSLTTTVTIPVAGDTVAESDETFTLSVSNPSSGYVIGAQATQAGTIVNDDQPAALPTLSIGNASVTEGNSGTTMLTYTVTASAASTSPITVHYATADGTATTADNDYAATSGTVTIAVGSTTAQIMVTVNGDTKYEGDETVLVNLDSPTNATIATAQGTGTIVNDDAKPLPTISIGNASVIEGNSGTTTLSYTVTASAASTSDITFHYSTADGTATAGSDYVAATGTGVIHAGDTTATVAVTVNGDTTIESNETVLVTIDTPTNATVATAQGTGTIVNDDSAGTVALSGGSVSQSEDAGAQSFTVTRTGGASGALTVSYAVTGSGTHAADANDFSGAVLPSGTVTFADGDTAAKTISIPVAADTTYEPDETYTVTLSSPTAGALGQATATGTIVNDDAAVLPTLSINNPAITEGNSGTKMLTFTVTTSAASASDITFHYSTADGTATVADNDYGAVSATGTIAAGATSTTISVPINGDTNIEPNETFVVTLNTPTNATIATAQGTGTIVSDDLATTATLLFTDFSGFAAKGFSPGATASSGQLDSNIWRVVGLSDNPNPAYGFTGPAGGDFGRGVIDSTSATATVKDPVSAGVYYPVNNAALVIQPTGAEFDVNGFVEARLANTTGQTITSVDIAFDWAYRNSGARADNLELFYSTDGVNFTAVPATAFSTPGPADGTLAANFSNQHEAIHLDNVTVGNGGNLFLRWEHLSSSGSQSRDEVGIDNVSVKANLSSAPAISVSDVAQAEGNSGQTDFVFTLTRSDPTGPASVQYATADGTARAGSDYQATSGTATFADGQLTTTVSVHVYGDTANEANESFYLNLSNPSAGLTLPDPQGLGTIQNDDTGPVAIYDIQGAGQMSPFAGQNVTTTGVVTKVVAHGFYLQDPMGDSNDATSDGIYVFVGAAATPAVTVGNAVSVAGTVAEYVGGTNNLPITELNTTNAQVTVTASVGATITPVLISADGDGRAPPTQVVDDNGFTKFDPSTQGADFYESLEGMLVTVKNPLVVGNTYQGSTFVVASNGNGATGLNSRDGLTLTATDQQPEKIKIFDTTQTHAQGEHLGNVTGVLTYYSGEYEVDPTQTVTTVSAGKSAADTARETTSLVGDAGHLSYASFNLENLSPVPDANGNDTQAKVDARFATHANELVNALHSPDILGLQEIQDNDGDLGTAAVASDQTIQKLIDAIVAAGGPAYKYVVVNPTSNGTSGGDPNGNIRDVFLYNPDRVSYVDGSAHRLENSVFAGTRYPLVADFTFNGQTITAIDQHSTSRGGSDPVYSSNQPPTQAGDGSRTAQADAIQQYIIQQHQTDPNHLFVVNGDFNGYYYEKALTDLVTGTDMANLYGKLAPEERYSYYFDGTYEAFDNIVVSNSLYGGTSFDVVHYNAGYADGLSTTDHDQVVATIGLARTSDAVVAVADNYATTAAAVLHGTVLANDTGGAGTISVAAINGDATQVGAMDRLASGALLTLTANGGFSYDTDGAFSSLAAGATATDQFSYTLANGSTATATITITGVATPALDANGHIDGTSGNDTYGGTSGADYFDLSAGGNDSVDGGAGADAFYLGGALTAAEHINGGSGADQVGLMGDYTGANALVLSATTLTNIETLAVLPGGSTPHSYDITSNDAMVGAGQTFTVYGSNLAAGENFTFNGSAETDGSFLFFGGLGTDTFTGGAKADGFFFGPDKFGPTDVVHGGDGIDQLGLDGHTGALTLDSTHTDVEVLALLNGPAGSAPDTYGIITVDDSWVAAGQIKTITAVTSFQSSTDPVSTSLVIDGSHETNGNLNIYGGSANDTLIGGAGADHLYGGLGADTLTGGAGKDEFLYNDAHESTGTTFDTLTDFTIGTDTINIAGQGSDSYTTVAGGTLTTAHFDADMQAAVGAQLSTGHAVFFTPTMGDYANQTFLVVDGNGAAGYQTGGDLVFHVPTPAATIPTAGLADFITH